MVATTDQSLSQDRLEFMDLYSNFRKYFFQFHEETFCN